ncbi:MAG: hypothetical protein ACW981_06790 [Candidatus Hodarchaeales archaeon]|jgi:hypothetical protein
MTNSKLQFCFECGSVLEKGKICKKCSPFLSKNLKKTEKTKSELEKKIPQRFFTKKTHGPGAEQEENEQEQEYGFVKKKRPRTVAIYSEERGLEVGWDLDTPEKRSHRAVFCVKCRKLKANWEGIWIVPGGKGRSLDPEIKLKRVFLCGHCWSPYKNRKKVSVEEIGLPEDQLFNPL